MRSSSRHAARLKLQTAGKVFFLFLPATIPLLFGAVHPIVQGLYTAMILIGCGGWLLLNAASIPPELVRSRWNLVFLVFLGWLLLAAVPLPLGVLEILSPTRAASLVRINELAGTDIRAAALGYNSLAALRTTIFLFSLLLYGLCLRVLLERDRSFLLALIFTCVGLGVFEALYGMLQVLNPRLGVLWLTSSQFKGMATGTIIYKNQYASLLNLCWPLAVGAALIFFQRERDRGIKKKKKTKASLVNKLKTKNLQGTILLFLAALIMMAVLFSQSRGGTISMALILILLLVSLPLEKKNKIRLAGSLALMIMAYGSIIGFSSIIDRFLKIGESGLNRLTIYTASLPMLRDHLLTGIGLESYQLLSPVYLKNFPEKILFDRAHNEYLELAIELGLPMAAALFTALLTAMALWTKRLKQWRGRSISQLSPATLIALVSLCALAGFLVHGIADFGWRLPANLLYAVTLAALVGHGTGKGADHSRSRRRKT